MRLLSLTCAVGLLMLGVGCGRNPPAPNHQAHTQSGQSVSDAMEVTAKKHAEKKEQVDELLEAQEKLLAHMEGRLHKLEKLLSSQGKGAYRGGPSLTLTGSGDTLLQSLHEFEQTVIQLRAEQSQLGEQNTALRQRLNEINTINERLRDQLTLLREADEEAETLRQEYQNSLANRII